MRRSRKKRELSLDIAPVNLIDLLLVMLIFFVTTTSFLQLKVIELDIPVADETKTQYKKKLTHVISIDKECKFYYDKGLMSLRALSINVKDTVASNKDSIFQVAADMDSKHQCFVDVLDVLKANNIKNLSILTEERK